MDPAVQLEGVEKAFEGHRVLEGLDLALPRGTTLSVMGGSGTGKTVLLRLIAGLIQPDAGRIQVLGEEIVGLREEALLPIRRRMGFVFQGAALFDSLSVFENVAFPLREHTALGEAAIADRVHRALEMVGLERVDHLPPAELSGGMRKRVGIARALVLDPELVLYDEPTAGLDPANARLIAELIGVLKARKVSETAMVVTHDFEFAATVSDQIGLLHRGRLVEVADPEALRASATPEVRAFLAGEVAR